MRALYLIVAAGVAVSAATGGLVGRRPGLASERRAEDEAATSLQADQEDQDLAEDLARDLADEDEAGDLARDLAPQRAGHGLASPATAYVDRQWSEDPHANVDHVEQIKSGELGLAGISFGPNSFAGVAAGRGRYEGVYGEFCAYDATGNRDDPASAPTVNELLAASRHCAEHSYAIDMNEVMAAVDAHDATKKHSGVRRLPLTSVIAHEGHSGAGLLSNVLSTFDDTVVHSEHPALRDALSACDTTRNRYLQENCDNDARLRLVKDVMTVLSRTVDPALEEVHVKLHSESGSYLRDLTSLYPRARWAFVYRDPRDALSSTTERGRIRNCVRAKRNPSTALAAKAEEGGIDLEGLSGEEVCALHLSTLVDAAANESRSGSGKLISYDADIADNPENVLDNVLPSLGRVADRMSPRARARAKEVLAARSRAVGGTGGNDKWDASESKKRRRGLVTDEIVRASDLFMKDSMEALERAAGGR